MNEQHDPPPLGAESPDAKDLGAVEMPVAMVEGVYCKNGHFNDPEARYCAVCGIGMGQLTKVRQMGRRPPLGALILADGSMSQLDADCVLGREPTLDSSVADGRARPLRLTDASRLVSRIHARVELDGWQVFISDLHSANGTQILLPGENAPTRLEPGVRTPLVAGAQIRLGGEYGLTYDSHRHLGGTDQLVPGPGTAEQAAPPMPDPYAAQAARPAPVPYAAPPEPGPEQVQGLDAEYHATQIEPAVSAPPRAAPVPPPAPADYVPTAPPPPPDPYVAPSPPPPDPYLGQAPQPGPGLAGGPPGCAAPGDEESSEVPQRDPLPLGAEPPEAKELGIIEMPVAGIATPGEPASMIQGVGGARY